MTKPTNKLPTSETTTNPTTIIESDAWITPANIVTVGRFLVGLEGARQTANGNKKLGFTLQALGWIGDGVDGRVAKKGIRSLCIAPHMSSTGRLADHTFDRAQAVATAVSAIKSEAAPQIYSRTLLVRELGMGALASVGAKMLGTDAIKPTEVGRYVHAANGVAFGAYLAADAFADDFPTFSEGLQKTAHVVAAVGAIGSIATLVDYASKGVELLRERSDVEWIESADGIG